MKPGTRTADQAKADFRAAGVTFSQWAIAHGYRPSVVYAVLRGAAKGARGEARQVMRQLGIKTTPHSSQTRETARRQPITPGAFAKRKGVTTQRKATE